ncbi:MAG: murein hydrolase activator EnvC family protein, partial [Elusimicrobiales bacterium]
KELSSLIKKIEKSSPYKKEISSSVSLPKKSLPWPAEGVVVKKFGKEYVEDLKTWIINDGIKIKTTSLEVKPVMAGKVVYSGEFRGFGNVVILDHGDNIYSTYGFLSQISVSNGSVVDLNTVIGTAGTDIRDENLNGNILYFEIRKGENALNPTDYLR